MDNEKMMSQGCQITQKKENTIERSVILLQNWNFACQPVKSNLRKEMITFMITAALDGKLCFFGE